MTMEHCGIIRDLLPVYADGLASAETKTMVEDHLEHCEACRAELQRMTQTVENADPVKNTAFRTALKKLKSNNQKRTILTVVLTLALTTAIVLGILWHLDVFYYAGSYRSPDGRVTTTVYNRDITQFLPEKEHFTLVDEGAWQGRTILWGTFDSLWWSADSIYQVVSLLDEGEYYLMLFDFLRNTGSNLDAYLGSALYGLEEFRNVPKDEDGREEIEFRFLQWSQYDSSMLIYFSYVDTDGIDRDGYFWYSYATGEITGVMFLETAVVDGVVNVVGTDFYSLQLDRLDENGNVLEFVFTTSAATQLRGLDTLKEGDHIRMVCHGPAEFAQRPWSLDFGTATDETVPTAISVTALE